MYPILLQWGPLVVPSWHAFYAMGALLAYILLLYLRKYTRTQFTKESLSQLFVVCYAAGYFGARLLSILVEEPQIADLKAILAAMVRFGPMTFYGGGIAAFVAGTLFCVWRRLPLSEIMDLGMPAGFLALAVGRLGCFLNGDDYGKPVSLDDQGQAPVWGIILPALEDHIPRWPVQLIESGLVFLLVVGLVWFFVRRAGSLRPGFIGFLSIVCYAHVRFACEFLRDDFRGFAFGTWLSTSQFIAVVTLAIAGVIAPFWISQSVPTSRS